MNAIMVKNNDGYYEISGAATVEDWDEVAEAESVLKIEDLAGWGEYTAAYKVRTDDGRDLTYFVAE